MSVQGPGLLLHPPASQLQMASQGGHSPLQGLV